VQHCDLRYCEQTNLNANTYFMDNSEITNIEAQPLDNVDVLENRQVEGGEHEPVAQDLQEGSLGEEKTNVEEVEEVEDENSEKENVDEDKGVKKDFIHPINLPSSPISRGINSSSTQSSHKQVVPVSPKRDRVEPVSNYTLQLENSPSLPSTEIESPFQRMMKSQGGFKHDVQQAALHQSIQNPQIATGSSGRKTIDSKYIDDKRGTSKQLEEKKFVAQESSSKLSTEKKSSNVQRQFSEPTLPKVTSLKGSAPRKSEKNNTVTSTVSSNSHANVENEEARGEIKVHTKQQTTAEGWFDKETTENADQHLDKEYLKEICNELVLLPAKTGGQNSQHYIIKRATFKTATERKNGIRHQIYDKDSVQNIALCFLEGYADIPSSRSRSQSLEQRGYYELKLKLSRRDDVLVSKYKDQAAYLAHIAERSSNVSAPDVRSCVYNEEPDTFVAVRIFENKDRPIKVSAMYKTSSGEIGIKELSASSKEYLSYSGPIRVSVKPTALVVAGKYSKMVMTGSEILLKFGGHKEVLGLKVSASVAQPSKKLLQLEKKLSEAQHADYDKARCAILELMLAGVTYKALHNNIASLTDTPHNVRISRPDARTIYVENASGLTREDEEEIRRKKSLKSNKEAVAVFGETDDEEEDEKEQQDDDEEEDDDEEDVDEDEDQPASENEEDSLVDKRSMSLLNRGKSQKSAPEKYQKQVSERSAPEKYQKSQKSAPEKYQKSQYVEHHQYSQRNSDLKNSFMNKTREDEEEDNEEQKSVRVQKSQKMSKQRR
jgi:hypothetical protein